MSRRRRSHPSAPPVSSAAAPPLLFIAGAVLIPLVPVIDLDLAAYAVLPKLAVMHLIALGVSIIWAAGVVSGRSRIPRSPLMLPVAGFFFLSALSTLDSINPFAASLFLSHQVAYGATFLLAASCLRRDHVDSLFSAIAGVGLVIALLGSLESFGVGAAWLPLSDGRPSATFGYRNFAASWLVAAIPFASVVWLRGPSRSRRWLGGISTVAMSLLLVYTRSRGAWAGLAAAVLAAGVGAVWLGKPPSFFQFLKRQPPMRLAAGVAVAAAFLLMAMRNPTISGPESRAIDEKKADLSAALATSLDPRADKGRLAMWRGTLNMMRDAPVLGVGPGNWEFVYPLYDHGQMVTFATAPLRPHNDLLWIASEVGLPALLLYLWLLGGALCCLVSIARSGIDNLPVALALAAGLVATAVHSLFSFPRALPATSYIVWLSLGLTAALHATPRPLERPHRSHPATRLTAALLPIVLLLSFGITTREIRFDAHYWSVLAADAGGDMATVWRESEKALKAGPFNPTAFLYRAKGDQAAGRLLEAESTLRKGLVYHPNSTQLLGDLGTVLASGNRLDAAEAAYRKALSILPNHHQVLNNLGGVYQKRGDFEAAIDLFKQAIHIRPDDYVDAYANLGLTQLAAHRPDEAIQTYSEAIRRFPDEAVLHSNLGDAFLAKADAGEAAYLQPARRAYTTFLKLWRGPTLHADAAHNHIAAINRRLEALSDANE